MKKFRLITICVVALLLISIIAGCSSDASTTTSAQAESTTTDSEEIPFETKEMLCNDSVVSTDIFQVTKPDGWIGIRQYDKTTTPVNGVYPVDETKLCLTKGGEDEDDIYTLPTVYVYYEDSAVKLEDLLQWYNDYEMLDDVTINGVSCEACLATMDSYYDTDISYVYGIVLYPITENETIEFTVTVYNPDGEGIEMDDSDVVTIMNSVVLVN